MKTTITAALALVLLAGSATAALAQDQGGHRGDRGDGAGADGGGRQGGGHNGGGQNVGGQNRSERPQFQDTERRDMMGGADNRGQRRSEFQVDQHRGAAQAQVAPQAPVAPPARTPRQREQFRGNEPAQPGTRVAPQAPGAPPARMPRSREQFRGNEPVQPGVQSSPRANRDVAGRQQDAARQGGVDRRGDGNSGSRDGRRWDGDRNGGSNNGDRNNGFNNGDRRDWDRRGGDRNDGNRNGWNRHDDRGRPHWQQGRYPPVYRSHQRYRYGYYRPPIGFYAHSWAFGEFLPHGWYGSDYLLNDWWSYGLPYPPLGYDWVRVGNDALLIDSYSGQVVQVVQDIFW